MALVIYNFISHLFVVSIYDWLSLYAQNPGLSGIEQLIVQMPTVDVNILWDSAACCFQIALTLLFTA
jgi:hypothetical protein